MRLILSLSTAAILSACAMSSTPPGGTCVTRASTELNALMSAIQSAETNLARGYVIVSRVSAETAQIEEVELPINAANERNKLANLNAKLDGVQAQTDAAVAMCAG